MGQTPKGTDDAPRSTLARRVARALTNAPGAGLVFVPQRTAGYALQTWLRHRATPDALDPPAPPASLALTAQVALDELMLGWMKSPRRFPERGDYAAVAAELREARALYRERGFIAHPGTYHREPPEIQPTIARRRLRGLAYERLSWESGYEPHAGEPGAVRWLGYEGNRTAHAIVLRGDPAAPWVLCVHGFGTGMALTEFFAFRARHLQQDLGLNVVFPVLPLHGPRRVGRVGGAELMSYQLQNYVLGMAQSVWDIRALIGWLRGQASARIGVHGMSLGAYVASLLATLDRDLELVIAGAPMVDVPELFVHHSTATLRRRIDPDGTLGDVAREVHRVISPLAARPVVSPERLYVYAGLGDRMSPPAQARALVSHWGTDQVAWYEGSHVTFLWSADVARFVDDALAAGFSGRSPRRASKPTPAGGTRERGRRRARS